MKQIETYFHKGDGYNPFLIKENWQVAQLNFMPDNGFDAIDRVERHNKTDEVFILHKGTAILISLTVEGDRMQFELLNMKPGITYNVPAGTWHSIAMDNDAMVIIVENSNTHLHDVDYIRLTSSQKNELLIKINNEI